MSPNDFFYVEFQHGGKVAEILADNKVIYCHMFRGGRSRFYLESREEIEYAIDLIAELNANPIINDE